MKLLKKFKSNEDGIFAIFLAAIFAAIITVVAFAVDAGTLYLAEINLKRSVDAATISAASALSIKETNCSSNILDAEIRSIAQTIIDENISLNSSKVSTRLPCKVSIRKSFPLLSL